MNGNIYDFKVKKINGEEISLSEYKGKVLLIVNTASKCGFTPQYKELEALYKKYKDNGFEILGFPSNQFLNQEPGTNEEIAKFCEVNYGVTFQMFDKIDVNGKNVPPLYAFLKNQKKGILSLKDIKWNFTKFLIDRDGSVIERFAPNFSPEKIEPAIKELLKI
jgi:glutathione peroxidase